MNEEIEIELDHKKQYDKMIEIISKSDYDSISIFCHDQPDPDCLASAMAVGKIAENYNKSYSIYYGGSISHTQNRVMINVLDIPAIRLDKEEEEETQSDIRYRINNSIRIIVDTSYLGSGNSSAVASFVSGSDYYPHIIIDHHAVNHEVDSRSLYIRRNYGSCSTILQEILEYSSISCNKNIATALCLGITTDTSDLKAEGSTEYDERAYGYLKNLIDLEKYLQIFNYPKPFALLDLRKKAYSNIRSKGNMAIAHVGIITPQQRSLIAELCEEILEIESIETSVVMAIVDEGLKGKKSLVSSVRSSLLAINMKDFVNKIYGKKGSGGRKGSGGACVELDSVHALTIDGMRSKYGDESEVISYISHIFDIYSDKILEEKENV